jgi:hypothetical protein
MLCNNTDRLEDASESLVTQLNKDAIHWYGTFGKHNRLVLHKRAIEEEYRTS